MKTPKVIAVLVNLIFLLVAIGCDKTPNTPPPGYKILGNHNCTKFVVVMPHGARLGRIETYPEKAFKSRKSALKRAWSQYNFKSKVAEIDTMKLIDCSN